MTRKNAPVFGLALLALALLIYRQQGAQSWATVPGYVPGSGIQT